MAPLLNKILEHVPPPKVKDGPFKMIATMMSYDNFLGRILLGRIYQGSVKVGDNVKGLSIDGQVTDSGKVIKMLAPLGVGKIELNEAR